MGKKFKKQAQAGNRMRPLGSFTLIVEDGQMDIRMDRHTDGQTYIWTDRHMDRHMDGQTYPLIEMQGRIKKTYL